MRKILISVFVCLLFIMTVFSIVKGNDLLKVEGFMGLYEKNKDLDNRIEELSQTINIGYTYAQDDLEKSVDNLLEAKTEYETQVILASSNEENYTSEMYSVDYLWTRLGNYAKDEQIDLDIGVYASGVDNLYDLKFTLKGSYLGITNFIYDIEDNSKLGFKIDDFSMTGNSASVTASFTCESIYINIGNAANPKVTENKEQTKNNTTPTNTTTTNTAATSPAVTNTAVTNTTITNTTKSTD